MSKVPPSICPLIFRHSNSRLFAEILPLRPAVDVDFMLDPRPDVEQNLLLRLARSISFMSGDAPALSMEKSGVQIPIFTMLLAPLKAGLAMPTMTLAFLGLEDRLRNKECLYVIIDELQLFSISNGRHSELASKGFELIYRVCLSCQAMGGGRLEARGLRLKN